MYTAVVHTHTCTCTCSVPCGVDLLQMGLVPQGYEMEQLPPRSLSNIRLKQMTFSSPPGVSIYTCTVQ